MRPRILDRRSCAAFVVAAALAHAALCACARAEPADDYAPDRPEPGSVERIREEDIEESADVLTQEVPSRKLSVA